MASPQNGTDDDVIILTQDDVVDSPRSAADSPRDEEDLPGGQSLEPDSEPSPGVAPAEATSAPATSVAATPAEAVSSAATPAEATSAAATPTEATSAAAAPADATSAAGTSSGAVPEGVVQASANWPEIQATFVDDPRRAVQQAAEVTGAALSAVVAAAQEREQALRQGWQADGAGTEELRTTLQHYRELSTRLVALSQGL
jgi:hypothetical protein